MADGMDYDTAHEESSRLERHYRKERMARLVRDAPLHTALAIEARRTAEARSWRAELDRLETSYREVHALPSPAQARHHVTTAGYQWGRLIALTRSSTSTIVVMHRLEIERMTHVVGASVATRERTQTVSMLEQREDRCRVVIVMIDKTSSRER